MRKATILAIATVAGGLGSAASAVDLSGTWQINGQIRPVCTITQTGSQLSGHCKGPAAEGPLNGTNDGQAVQFTFQRGQLAPVIFSGTTSGDSLSGTLAIGQGRGTAFTAQREGGTPQPVAAPPPVAATGDGPPATVWAVGANGSAVHQQTGMVCPGGSGALKRGKVIMFDKVGFDVACNYQADGVDLTLYLTLRDPARLQQSFDASRQMLAASNPGAVPHAGTITAPQGLIWLQAAFDVQGGTQRADILYTQLYGWEYEIRATYRPESAAIVTAAIADLTATARNSSGGHLASCRGTQPANGEGVRNRDLDALQGLSAISAALVKIAIANPLAESQWCPDIGFGINGGDYIWWHSLTMADDAPVIRISNIKGGNTVLVVRVPQAVAKETVEKMNGKFSSTGGDFYAVAVDEAESTKIAGIFNGRPSFKDVTDLVVGGKAFGVYAEIKKAGGNITVYKPF